MTVAVDNISGDITIKMDKKPETASGEQLLEAIKSWNFAWKGYGDKGRWQGKNACVEAFNDRSFKARIKSNCKGISFYDLNGKHLGADVKAFIESAQSYDPSNLDDDFSDMGSSSVAPVTPASTPDKRQRIDK